MGMGYAFAFVVALVMAAPLLWLAGWVLGDLLEAITGNAPRSGPHPSV